jgi:putative aldouronate transport system permease protein
MGWEAIIYIAALAGISPELYEAASIDGAGKFKKILHIDIPGILPTIIVLLILNTGKIMNIGFEKAYLMQNPVNLEASEIIATYVYKVGLLNFQFSFSTAVDLFNTVINFILLFAVNIVSKRTTDIYLW